MLAKTTLLQTWLLAFFVMIPLFRPILITHNLIYSLYAVFAVGFLVLVVNLDIMKYSNPKQVVLLSAYCSMSVAASLFAAQDIRLDYLGLLCFLPISYFLGIWLGERGSVHGFFRAAALIFMPIASYIVYQLAKSSFSYNTYYYWSSATYKIDYLTASLYAGILFVYFGLNGRNILETIGLPLFSFAFIGISGARYSIIFMAVAGTYMMLRTASKAPARLAAGLLAALLVGCAVFLFNDALVGKSTELMNYSKSRLENMVGEDKSVQGRVALMQKASDVISEHFSFGVGLAGSGEALDSNYPHNMLLEAFIDGGFFTVLPLIMFFVYSIYALIRAEHEQKVWCVLVVMYLMGAFLKSFSIYESRILFLFIGYAATLGMREIPGAMKQEWAQGTLLCTSRK